MNTRIGLHNKRLISIILFGICFLVYANSLDGAFISDDVPAITRNPELIYPLRFWMEPASLLNSLNLLISGHNPFTYHLTNILLHSLNTILVFFFLGLFFGVESSLLGAVLFALHPIHTEAVTWISGKPYLIFCAFVLGNALLYNRVAEGRKRFGPALYLVSLAIFYYMTLQYYTYYLFPFLLILIDLTLKRWRKSWRLWVPFFLLAALKLASIKAGFISRIDLLSGKSAMAAPVWNNPVLTVAHSLFSNLSLMLWPLKLTLYHEPVVVSRTILSCEVILLFVLLASLRFIFKKEKLLFLAVMFFILFISPTFSPFIISWLIAERYLYLPSLSLSILAAFIYNRYGSINPGLRNKVLSLFILIMALYALRTISRNEDYRSPDKFWRQELKVSYGSASVHNKMGDIYRSEGKFKEAIEELNKALSIKPKDANAYNNLGVTYSTMGDKSAAVSCYLKAIEFDPEFAEAYFNLANAYSALGKNEEAIFSYRKAIALKGNLLEAYINLGAVYQGLGRNAEAIAVYRGALQIYPKMAVAHNNLAAAYYHEKKYDLAIQHLDLADKFGHRVSPELCGLLEPYRNSR